MTPCMHVPRVDTLIKTDVKHAEIDLNRGCFTSGTRLTSEISLSLFRSSVNVLVCNLIIIRGKDVQSPRGLISKQICFLLCRTEKRHPPVKEALTWSSSDPPEMATPEKAKALDNRILLKSMGCERLTCNEAERGQKELPVKTGNSWQRDIKMDDMDAYSLKSRLDKFMGKKNPWWVTYKPICCCDFMICYKQEYKQWPGSHLHDSGHWLGIISRIRGRTRLFPRLEKRVLTKLRSWWRTCWWSTGWPLSEQALDQASLPSDSAELFLHLRN